MSLYIDTNVVQAEIDRRFELAGVDRHDHHHHDHHHHHHDQHRHDRPARPLGAHPLVAFVARLVSRRSGPSPDRSLHGAPVAAHRPRHS